LRFVVESNHSEETMTSSNRGVPRGDHVPANEQDESIRAQQGENPDATGGDSASKRGHGAHGRGRNSEERIDAADPRPDFSSGTDRGGSAAWGSEGAGGSTFDKRSPGRKKGE
jgi:hypothetical protein